MPRAARLAIGSLAVALGTAASGAEWTGLSIAISIILGLALAAWALRSHRPAEVALAVGILTLALRVSLAWAVAPAVQRTLPPAADEGPWSAVVLSLGSTDGGQQRALVSVTRAGSENVTREASTDGPDGPWVLYAWLPRYPPLVPTDRLAFAAHLDPPPSDPGFAGFLDHQGAVGTVRIREVQTVVHGDDALSQLAQLRHGAGDLLARGLPQPESGLAAGILIGLREQVDRTLAADFTTAGLSHVVAISGWNIALVGAVVASLLRPLSRRSRSIGVLLAICAYTLLAGASASVVRAAVMGGVALVARESGRPGGAATALGLAVWLLLLVDPRMAADIGFQLSVAATAGLLAWGSRLQACLERRRPARAPGWLFESMSVSLAAQAATLPLILFHFGRLSLVAPVANLLAAPFVAPAMLAALAGLVVGAANAAGLPALLLAPLAIPAWLGLATLVWISRLAASMPLASVTLPSPLDLAAAVGMTVLVGVLGTATGGRIRSAISARWRKGRPERPAMRRKPATTAGRTKPAGGRTGSRRMAILLLASSAALLVMALGVVAERPDGRFRLTVLDVGQGDAILLEGTRGTRMLIDGGPDPDRLLTRLDERIPAWDRRVDLVVLSHPHEDHVAGLALLLQRYRVEAVAEPGMLGNGPGDHAFRQTLDELGLRSVILAAGDALTLDDAALTVLWPRRGEVPLHPANGGSAVNDVSIVFDARIGHRRMLLMGDVEQEIDPELLQAGVGAPGQPAVDVLKVAHHGSRTASTAAFLAAVRPRLALVSAGAGNPYGHPAPGTIQRLQESGARVLRTDLDGTLAVSTDGTDLRASATTTRAADAGRSTARPTVALAAVRIASAFSCGISGTAAVASSDEPGARPASADRRGRTVPTVLPGSRKWIEVRSGIPPVVRTTGLPIEVADPRPAPTARSRAAWLDASLHGIGGDGPRPWYDRVDDRPFARRSRARHAGRRPAHLVRAACVGRGGGRGIPRGTRRAARRPAGPGTCRGRGPPP